MLKILAKIRRLFNSTTLEKLVAQLREENTGLQNEQHACNMQ